MMFEMVFPACQTAMRVGFSAFVYHEDVTGSCQIVTNYDRPGLSLLRVIPGKKGASQSPVKKRTIQKPAPL